MQRTLGFLVLAAGLALAQRAWADPRPNPEAMRHFLQGKRLRDEGRCAAAIGELEASVGLEPSIGAHYNLGVCNEKLGKNRQALLHYDAALALAKDRTDERLREIRAQREEFLANTPHVRLALTLPVPPDLRVTVDGEVVPPEDLQAETRLFPSTSGRRAHEIVAIAAGFEEARLTVDEAALRRHDLLPLVLRRPEPEGGSEPVSPPAVVVQSGGWTWRHWTGIGVGAAGLVAMGFAGYVGVDYLIDRGAANAALDETGCFDEARVFTCPARDVTRADVAGAVERNNTLENGMKDKAPFAIGAAAVGGLLVAGGLVLFLTAPRAESAAAPPAGLALGVAPIVGPAHQGCALMGTF